MLEICPHGGTNASASIIFVTNANHAGDGATGAPDKPYTDLLTANGHQVTRWASHNDPTATDAITLNAADLIILGRSASSNHFRQDQRSNLLE